MPNRDGKFRVEVDASGYAIGAVLSQQQTDKKWKPIAFISKALNETERNYEIYDRELLAVMTALSEWRHYLSELPERFEIWTDHKNLEYFRQPQKLNRRQARWLSELQNYDFILEHKAGYTMGKADALSRRPDHDDGRKDNENIILLKPERFEVAYQDIDDGLMREVEEAEEFVEEEVKQAMEKEGGEAWKKEGKIIIWRERVYVPDVATLREEIMKRHHDSETVGHPGYTKTHELITRNFWWPRMMNDVKRYVAGCETCQAGKIDRQRKAAPLHPNQIPENPWEIISVDLVGPLPLSRGYDGVMVVVDRFTKMARYIPINMKISSMGVATNLWRAVFKDVGFPKKIISDRGPQFVAGFMRELCKMWGIERNPSTAYHPQTDGQTERVNQEMEQYLRLYIGYRQTDWADWISMAEFSYNNRSHAATGKSPFYLNYGRHPNIHGDTVSSSKAPAADRFAQQMEEIRGQTKKALEEANKKMKERYDENKREAVEYKVGDLVWLDGTDIMDGRPTKKLAPKRYGPFLITEKIGKSAYKLLIPGTWKKIHPVFNEVKLSPYKKPVFEGQAENSETRIPEATGVEEIMEVERILDSRWRGSELQYLVKWKGQSVEDATWELRKEIFESASVVCNDFHRQHPEAPRMPIIRIPPLLRGRNGLRGG
ncbi:hypothetical protein NP233_g1445 [Leucocoprinus birnbaumii]|uniref:Uncharacterized protein n=1 Tax=Leucocoprinus birnbaumii TaxID=56174 RepID=A0AAD5YXZ4_9AGAR|nr:hypothetical protein NP233_g1445 [Leucocoprinus birnbaumii]